MMDEDRGTIRSVAWSEIFPWLKLLRSFRLAIGSRVMILGALGVVLMLSGWWLLTVIFGGNLRDSVKLPPQAVHAPLLGKPESCPWTALTNAVPDYPLGLEPSAEGKATEASALPDVMADIDRKGMYFSFHHITGPWHVLGLPLKTLFSSNLNVPGLVYVLLCGLWSLVVWSFCGGAITRIVSVQLACDQRLPLPAVLRYVGAKWLAYFSAPIFPLLGILLAAVPAGLCGLLLRGAVFMWIPAILWPVFLVLGMIMTLLLLGLFFGWPLMWSTISTEGTDSFDALSRSYAYVFQRPLYYLFCIILAVIFGWLGWLLVSQFAAGVVGLTYWAASWGAGQTRIGQIVGGQHIGWGGDVWRVLIVSVWVGIVKIVAVGFTFSYFWTASTAIYYILRRSVDATEMDEVFLEEDEQTFELPAIKTEGPDAPTVGETPVAPPPPPASKPAEDGLSQPE